MNGLTQQTSFVSHSIFCRTDSSLPKTLHASAKAGLSPEVDPEGINFVINLDDGMGKEFYLTPNGNLVDLSDSDSSPPQTLQTDTEVVTLLRQLRGKYPASYRFYAVEFGEFQDRREARQSSRG